MLYRSYGAMLVIVAVLVVAGRYREQLAPACAIAGLILFIDLPLRWLGNIVPWREYDVAYWPISPYRGSHVNFIPTWLFGAVSLGIGTACFFSPAFLDFIERREPAPPMVQHPPPTEPPTGRLEIEIEEIAPFNGCEFRYTLHNRTGVRVPFLRCDIHYKTDKNPSAHSGAPLGELADGQKRIERLHTFGKADWIRVTAKGQTYDKREFTGEREWKRKK